MIHPDGRKSSIVKGVATPGVGIAPADADSVFVVDYGAGKIATVNSDGNVSIVAEGLASPVALLRKDNGNLLVGTWGDGKIHEISK